MIGVELTKTIIAQLKDNDAKYTIQIRPNDNLMDCDNKKDEILDIVDKQKYEKSVIECNKLQTFINLFVGRYIKVFS